MAGAAEAAESLSVAPQNLSPRFDAVAGQGNSPLWGRNSAVSQATRSTLTAVIGLGAAAGVNTPPPRRPRSLWQQLTPEDPASASDPSQEDAASSSSVREPGRPKAQALPAGRSGAAAAPAAGRVVCKGSSRLPPKEVSGTSAAPRAPRTGQKRPRSVDASAPSAAAIVKAPKLASGTSVAAIPKASKASTTVSPATKPVSETSMSISKAAATRGAVAIDKGLKKRPAAAAAHPNSAAAPKLASSPSRTGTKECPAAHLANKAATKATKATMGRGGRGAALGSSRGRTQAQAEQGSKGCGRGRGRPPAVAKVLTGKELGPRLLD